MTKLLDSTKEQKIKKQIKVWMILLLCVVSIFSANYAFAAGLKIKYDGKTITYTGAQTKMMLDGKKVSLGKVPGIIISDTCMVPLKEAIAKGLGASYTYDSETGDISIKQNNIVISMTVGSKKAYVNGKKKTLNVAPKRVKFYSANTTKVMVPFRFVAENLGYGYTWVNSEVTSKLTSPLVIRYEPNPQNIETVENEWITYTGTKGKVIYNGKEISLSDMPIISVNGTNLVQAEKVFADTIGVKYSYDDTTGTISLRRNDITITMTIDSSVAFINDVPYEMNTAARLVKNKDTQTSYVMIPVSFTAKNLGYGYTWNSSTNTSIITRTESDYTNLEWKEDLLTFPDQGSNMITNIKASHKSNTDIITITGLNPFTAIVNEDSGKGTITVEILNVFNQIKTIQKSFTDGIFIDGVTVNPSGTGISITLTKNASGSYYTSQSGNTFQIVMCEDITTDVVNSLYQMKFSLPEGVSAADIKDEDRYYENTFILTLTGDYIDYFSANPILYNPSVIKKITLSLSTTGNTKIKVETNKLQGYKLNDCGDYIGISVANPSEIYKNIVVLDAGHGGKDVGALNSSTNEKTLNFSIIYTKAKAYFDSKDSEIKAYWTRTDDSYISLTTRAAFAATVEADLFISLHMNSASSKTATGLEVLYASNNSHTMSGMNSKKMADIFKKQLISDLNMVNRGVKNRTNLVVLKSNVVPAVLIELGFISNASDFKKLSNDSFQDKAAASIYEAAKTCFETYPTGR